MLYASAVLLSKVTFRMPAELHLRLKLQAVRENRPAQDIVNELVKAYLDGKDEKK